MIPVLPDHIIRKRSTHTALKRLFLQIRQLPMDGARAWMSFASNDTPSSAPDFLLLDRHGKAYFLSAGNLKSSEFEEWCQPGLFELRPDIQDKILQLKSAASALGNYPKPALYADHRFFRHIPRLLICPELSPQQASLLSRKLNFPPGLRCMGLANHTLFDHLQAIDNPTLETQELKTIRATYLPECRVPESFIPRLSTSKLREQNRNEQFTDFLLDFDQESWVKNDLLNQPPELDPQQQTESKKNSSGPHCRLITGVAGSGKSLALLYRAQLLASISPQQRTLFVTHNKPLIGDLQWRYNEITHASKKLPHHKVEFFHFFRWLGHIHRQQGLQIIPEQQRQQTIAGLVSQTFPDSSWPASFYCDEIGFIADQQDDGEAAYLALDRSGRGLALDSRQRRQMHSLYRQYRTRLACNREADWHSLVRFLWEKARKGQLHLPLYDYIFVDEGQFFAPLWFSILKLCLNPQHGEIIVAADPTQGFLKRRQSWKSVGLNVRGRTTKLQRCYRNTAELQDFTRRFFLRRQSEVAAEEEIQLPKENAASTFTGKPSTYSKPCLHMIRHPTPQDSLIWIGNEITRAIEKGIPPQAMLVIHHSRRQLELLHSIIGQQIGSHRISMITHNDSARQSVALTTLNSATGIERPIVFLAGIDEIFELEDDPRLESNERKNMIRDHTRKIYMALTRAGEKLLISYTSDHCRRFFDD